MVKTLNPIFLSYFNFQVYYIYVVIDICKKKLRIVIFSIIILLCHWKNTLNLNFKLDISTLKKKKIFQNLQKKERFSFKTKVCITNR